MEIRLDLHVHTALSPDGRMTPEEVISLCRKRGIQGAAICDHGIVAGKLPEAEDILLIPGVEASTEYGHMLGLFVTEPIPEKPFAAAVAAIHAQGGFAVMAHPFAKSRDEHRLDDIIDQLDAVEIWNGRANRKNSQANAMALALAEKRHKPFTAGGDAHLPREVGNGVLVVEAEALTREAVKKALLTKAFRVEGRQGRAVDVARSQWTKRRKTGASLPAYAKWLLFAGKCLLQDIFQKGEQHYVFDSQDR